MDDEDIKLLEKMLDREIMIASLNYNNDELEIGNALMIKNKVMDIIKQEEKFSCDLSCIKQRRENIIKNLKRIYENSNDIGIKYGIMVASAIVEYFLDIDGDINYGE